jgi:hypothetical protein
MGGTASAWRVGKSRLLSIASSSSPTRTLCEKRLEQRGKTLKSERVHHVPFDEVKAKRHLLDVTVRIHSALFRVGQNDIGLLVKAS